MQPLQKRIIDELGVSQNINPAREVSKRVDFLTEYARATDAHGFVLGISGGQDSSLAGRLCQLAAQQLRDEGRSARFVAMRLPYGVQHDEDDAQRSLSFIQADEVITFNIKTAVDAVDAEFLAATGASLTDFTKGNVKARQRMVAQFAVGGERQMLVVGTDHAAEAVTGFFTKFGDGATDLMPLAGLTKGQGAALLQFLGAEEAIWLKTPTADLLDADPGHSDEASLGLSYEQIDAYLAGETVAEPVAQALESRYLQTVHKRTLPVTPFDHWWRT
jgi:NAD+ synthase